MRTKSFRIWNSSGQEFGSFWAETAKEALEALAEDVGFKSWSDLRLADIDKYHDIITKENTGAPFNDYDDEDGANEMAIEIRLRSADKPIARLVGWVLDRGLLNLAVNLEDIDLEDDDLKSAYLLMQNGDHKASVQEINKHRDLQLDVEFYALSDRR